MAKQTAPRPNPNHFNAGAAGRCNLSLLDSHRGRFVSVTFRKRTTGTYRTLTCIFSRSYLLGQWRFNPADKGLVPVYDVKAGHVKLIPLDGITYLRAGGQVHHAASWPICQPAEPTPCPVGLRPAHSGPEDRVPVPARRQSAAEMQRELAELF